MSKRQVRDTNREAEILESPVRMDGVGEDPVVKAMLSEEFVTGSDTYAGGIALQLAQLITGLQANSAQQNAIMARFDKYEKAQEAWDTDKKKFLEEVDKRAASLLTSNPALKERYQADWAVAAKEAAETASAQNAVAKLQFEAFLASEPKETIMSPGIAEIHREGDQLVPYVVPEVIAIKHKKWALPPGEPVEVPHTVAVRYREMQRTRAELKERQDLIKDSKVEANEASRGWNKISEKYKTGGDLMPEVVV
jgi:hypothetical protein